MVISHVSGHNKGEKGSLDRLLVSQSTPDGFLHLLQIRQALFGGGRIVMWWIHHLADPYGLRAFVLPVRTVAVGKRYIRTIRMSDKWRVPPLGRIVLNGIAIRGDPPFIQKHESIGWAGDGDF